MDVQRLEGAVVLVLGLSCRAAIRVRLGVAAGFDAKGLDKKGRVIAEGTSRELKAQVGSGFLHVHLGEGADPAAEPECQRIVDRQEQVRRHRQWHRSPFRRSGRVRGPALR